MKKDILAIVAAVLIIIVLIGGVEIQSVDEYYLSHIDDIKPDSETVFLSIRCDSIFDNYDKLDASLKNGDSRKTELYSKRQNMSCATATLYMMCSTASCAIIRFRRNIAEAKKPRPARSISRA